MNISINRVKAEWLRGFIEGLGVNRDGRDWEELCCALEKLAQKYNELLNEGKIIEVPKV